MISMYIDIDITEDYIYGCHNLANFSLSIFSNNIFITVLLTDTLFNNFIFDPLIILFST